MKHTAIILILAATLAAIGCGKKDYYMPQSTQKTPEATFVEDMRRKANGNVAALTPEERRKLDSITRGNTEAVIAMGPP